MFAVLKISFFLSLFPTVLRLSAESRSQKFSNRNRSAGQIKRQQHEKRGWKNGAGEGAKNAKSHPLVGAVRASLFPIKRKIPLADRARVFPFRVFTSRRVPDDVCVPIHRRCARCIPDEIDKVPSARGEGAVVMAGRRYVRRIAEKQFSVSAVSRTREKFRSSGSPDRVRRRSGIIDWFLESTRARSRARALERSLARKCRCIIAAVFLLRPVRSSSIDRTPRRAIAVATFRNFPRSLARLPMPRMKRNYDAARLRSKVHPPYI